MAKTERQKDRIKGMDDLALDVAELRKVVASQTEAIAKLTAQAIMLNQSVLQTDTQRENQRLEIKRLEQQLRYAEYRNTAGGFQNGE